MTRKEFAIGQQVKVQGQKGQDLGSPNPRTCSFCPIPVPLCHLPTFIHRLYVIHRVLRNTLTSSRTSFAQKINKKERDLSKSIIERYVHSHCVIFTPVPKCYQSRGTQGAAICPVSYPAPGVTAGSPATRHGRNFCFQRQSERVNHPYGRAIPAKPRLQHHNEAANADESAI